MKTKYNNKRLVILHHANIILTCYFVLQAIKKFLNNSSLVTSVHKDLTFKPLQCDKFPGELITLLSASA